MGDTAKRDSSSVRYGGKTEKSEQAQTQAADAQVHAAEAAAAVEEAAAVVEEVAAG